MIFNWISKLGKKKFVFKGLNAVQIAELEQIERGEEAKRLEENIQQVRVRSFPKRSKYPRIKDNTLKNKIQPGALVSFYTMNEMYWYNTQEINAKKKELRVSKHKKAVNKKYRN